MVLCNTEIGYLHLSVSSVLKEYFFGQGYICTVQLKYFLNRCVFGVDLKLSRVCACLMSLGSLFHRVGAATLKALSANVLVHWITSKSSSMLDLNPLLALLLLQSRDLRYSSPIFM